MTTEQPSAPLYTPPRLRVSAKYAAGSAQAVDIEVSDAAAPITGAFVADLVAALVAKPSGGGDVSRPLRTADELFGGRITWSPSTTAASSTTTATAAIPAGVATYVQSGGTP